MEIQKQDVDRREAELRMKVRSLASQEKRMEDLQRENTEVCVWLKLHECTMPVFFVLASSNDSKIASVAWSIAKYE